MLSPTAAQGRRSCFEQKNLRVWLVGVYELQDKQCACRYHTRYDREAFPTSNCENQDGLGRKEAVSGQAGPHDPAHCQREGCGHYGKYITDVTLQCKAICSYRFTAVLDCKGTRSQRTGTISWPQRGLSPMNTLGSL
jgi:hypothetical protein